MALSKEMADRFFDDHEADFEGMVRLFVAAGESGDPDILAYVMTCVEKVATCTFQAMRADQKPQNISWH